MLNFLIANLANIIIGAVLIVIVALIVRNMFKRKKRGQCATCDGCNKAEGCPSNRQPPK